MQAATRIDVIGYGLVLVALASCAPRLAARETHVPSARAIVERAANAIGGAARISAARTLAIEGAGTTRSFGQSVDPAGPLPIVDVPQFRRVVDLVAGRWRAQQTQARRPPSPNTIPVTSSFGITDTRAYTIDDEGTASLDPPDVERERRAELLHHPLGLLRAALAPGAALSNARRGHGRDLVEIAAPGGRYTLAVDPATGLPASVASWIADPVLGDIALETDFGGYQPVSGLVLPTELVTRRDGSVVASFVVRNQIDATVAAAPPDLPAVAPPPPVTVEPLAAGIWLLGGSSHHSVLVELADRALLIEAPRDEARALAVIAAARAVLGARPLTHVIVTHHHHDHAAGVRAAVAQGLGIVAHVDARAFVEDLVARHHTLVPDALSRRPVPLTLVTVADRHLFGDGARRVELYPISGNAHASTLLMVYVPHARILVTADLFDRSSTGAFPFAENLVDNVDRLGLAVDTLVGLHGPPWPFGEVRAAAARARRRAH